MDDRRAEVARLQQDANTAKDRLCQISSELRCIGAIRKAKSLETIIEKLEHWQNS